jgi:hypothetical protein
MTDSTHTITKKKAIEIFGEKVVKNAKVIGQGDYRDKGNLHLVANGNDYILVQRTKKKKSFWNPFGG